MHGSSGSRGLLVHLIAGAALGAVIVLMVWIFSGGRPFGEVVGTSDVSEPTTTATMRTDVQTRAAAPAETDARLESELPALAERKTRPARKAKGGDALQFRKPAAAKRKASRAAAKERAARRARARKRPVVRVVSPPAGTDTGGEDTVAAVPSPAAPAVPVASPAPAAKPPKPRAPSYVAGAGEG
jgi:hypothetical protein